jgi:hypothetical protein
LVVLSAWLLPVDRGNLVKWQPTPNPQRHIGNTGCFVLDEGKRFRHLAQIGGRQSEFLIELSKDAASNIDRPLAHITSTDGSGRRKLEFAGAGGCSGSPTGNCAFEAEQQAGHAHDPEPDFVAEVAIDAASEVAAVRDDAALNADYSSLRVQVDAMVAEDAAVEERGVLVACLIPHPVDPGLQGNRQWFRLTGGNEDHLGRERSPGRHRSSSSATSASRRTTPAAPGGAEDGSPSPIGTMNKVRIPAAMAA